MDKQILAQAEQKRKLRALKIVEAGTVYPNGQPHQYYVMSQAGDGRYLAATPELFPPTGKCSCPDGWAKANGIRCKHIIAAEIHEQAEPAARALAEKHGLSFGQLESKLLADLCSGMPEPMATKVTIVLHACQQLKERTEKRAPYPLDEIQSAIAGTQETISQLKRTLAQDPDNRVAKAQLVDLQGNLKALHAQEKRALADFPRLQRGR